MLTACSTSKNTFVSRTYHNTISHYNIFFNGNESFKKGIARAEAAQADNYSKILPVFYYSNPEIIQSIAGDMDRAIKKATKVLTLHSITAKPELKKGPQSPKQKEFYNQKEFNKWIDDNYLLLGKAYVYQNKLSLAQETFKHIIVNFPDKPIRYAAFIWLARAYTEDGEYREAEKILNSLKSDDKMPSRYREDFYTTFADLYLREKSYPQAADMLGKAIKLVRKKHYRIRYTYILAQVYQESGQAEKALKAYKKVIKLKPPYEMTFNAKINMAGAFQAGSDEGREIRNLLNKMQKDEKNKDFQDQIYYALANIAMKEGKKDEAIELYKQSVSKSVSNTNQKGLSYLALADIYYAIPKYALAQAYYDSTVQNIDNTYFDYQDLTTKTNSLTHLVENLNVYELEDSVQNLAKMPEGERLAIIDKLIEEVVAKEQEEQKRKAEEALNIQYGMMNQNSPTTDRSGNNEGGSWYFYNMNLKSFGQPDFRMRWGNRKLEDNWRRKNKQSVENFDIADAQVQSDSTSNEKKAVILSNKTREYYLQNIPFTDSALAKSNERLVAALFGMGEVYENELKDNRNAIASYKELIKRYPSDSHVLPSYINLYEIYNEMGDAANKELYKNLIISKFPDSPKAKMLSNPDYVKELEAEMNKVSKFYEDTYQNYKSGNYNACIQNANYAISKYKDDDLIPRFMLLRALSLGQLQGKEKLKIELDTLVKTYPKHEVSAYAKDLIEYIYSMSPEIKTADVTAKAEEIYSYKPAETHYLIIAATPKSNMNQLNFNLVNFNLDNFDQLNLGILKAEIPDRKLLVVQSFSDLENAQRYLSSLKSKKADIISGNNAEDITFYIISASNYEKLLLDKSVEKYRLFYEKYYLSGGN